MKLFIRFLFVCFFCIAGHAQCSLDSIQKLDEIVLSDTKLKRYAKGYKVAVLSDSILKKNGASLTDVLRYNSNIYFRENGYGMVSSASFRGTNASQTAVIWNGININSQLNGQVDFNTISTSNYNSIAIRSGGGSVQYGSGAIGGSVHLNNDLKFGHHIDNTLRLSYGSFDTKNAVINTSLGEDLWTANIGVAYRESQNNYKFLGTDKENENGAFNNLDLNASFGYVFSKKDVIKFYHQNFRSDRAFSGSLVAPSKSKYLVDDSRTLLEWARISNKFKTKLQAVNLIESYKYFENKNTSNFTKGSATNWLLKYNLNYQFSRTLDLNTITDYRVVRAKGDSFSNPKRDAFSVTAILSHKPLQKLQYALSVRQDVNSDFKSPLVFSADANFYATKCYALKLNASKNYRIPTFNDLYWQPGGNLDLKSESSYQIDLGHVISVRDIKINLNTFYIESRDLIQWRPNSSLGYWSPINIASTNNYGVEVGLSINKRIREHFFNLKSNYSYTKAIDLENDKDLIYVPNHNFNTSLSYNFKAFTAFYQHLITSETETTGWDVDGFDIGNLGFSYNFNTKRKIAYLLDFTINNLYDTYYENMSLRPMPNRNFKLQLTLKF